MEYIKKAIPQQIHPDFKKRAIPIQECGEELINVDTYQSPYVIEKPMYHKQQITGALPHCYVRESVMKRLEEVAQQLPQGYQFVIWDGYRPFQVQKAIYDEYYEKIMKKFPNDSTEKWQEETEKFVSLPSVDPDHPAPHITGGAVDVAICNAEQQLLDFGTAFDDFSEKANTAYFEKKAITQPLTEQEQHILENRRLLYHLMTEVGFSNYYQEWWHFDYGNPWWAQNKEKEAAIYGIAH